MSESDIDASLWLDSVRVVPTIGLRFVPTLDTASLLIGRLKPLLLKWQSTYVGLKVSTQNEKVSIERPDGYEITVGSENLACKFYYISSIVEIGQDQPIIRYQSPRVPFAQICNGIQEVLGEILAELSKDGNRSIKLIGVVAEGNFDPEAPPPGFEAYLKHLGLPWRDGILEINGDVVALLNSSDDFTDRCHHVVQKPIDKEKVVNFKLDWQRVWSRSDTPNLSKLKNNMADARKAAFDYFGKFGLGALSYGP